MGWARADCRHCSEVSSADLHLGHEAWAQLGLGPPRPPIVPSVAALGRWRHPRVSLLETEFTEILLADCKVTHSSPLAAGSRKSQWN